MFVALWSGSILASSHGHSAQGCTHGTFNSYSPGLPPHVLYCALATVECIASTPEVAASQQGFVEIACDGFEDVKLGEIKACACQIYNISQPGEMLGCLSCVVHVKMQLLSPEKTASMNSVQLSLAHLQNQTPGQ